MMGIGVQTCLTISAAADGVFTRHVDRSRIVQTRALSAKAFVSSTASSISTGFHLGDRLIDFWLLLRDFLSVDGDNS